MQVWCAVLLVVLSGWPGQSSQGVVVEALRVAPAGAGPSGGAAVTAARAAQARAAQARAAQARAAQARLSKLAPRNGTEAAVRSEAFAAFGRTLLAESDGAARHALICAQLKARGGRRPESCPECWMRREACACAAFEPRQPLPADVAVYVWMHHREWGRASNTGSVLAATLEPRPPIWCKGDPADDAALEALLSEDDALTAVLWPVGDDLKAPQELRALAATTTLGSGPRNMVNLLVVDASWRNARRMVSSLPQAVVRCGVPLDLVRAENPNYSSSKGGADDDDDERTGTDHALNLLAPLRKPTQKREADVCTAQAAVAALRALGHDPAACDHTLRALAFKIEILTTIRGSSHQSKR